MLFVAQEYPGPGTEPRPTSLVRVKTLVAALHLAFGSAQLRLAFIDSRRLGADAVLSDAAALSGEVA
jgi:hypothetical protein